MSTVNRRKGHIMSITPGTITLERAMATLSPSLKTTLALLAPAADDVAELTLATLPLGSRTTLSALGIMTTEDASPSEAPVDIALTDFGREVITACALEGLPDDVAEQVTKLEEARARRAADASEPIYDLIETDR
jgi:hypothetical protein